LVYKFYTCYREYMLVKLTCTQAFSGFSVGCCINEEKVYLFNLSLENSLSTFQLNGPIVIRVKVKKCETNTTIYRHALLRICVIGGQRLVRIAPPFLPAHHSGPATRIFSPPSWLKRFSEGVIWMCRASFTNICCPLPMSSTVWSPPSGWGGGSPTHAAIIILSQESRCSFSLVSNLCLVSPM